MQICYSPADMHLFNYIKAEMDRLKVIPDAFISKFIHCIHQHIQPELIGIIQGKINSNLHNIYWHGSKSEKSNIHLHDNFGPSKVLPDHLVSH